MKTTTPKPRRFVRMFQTRFSTMVRDGFKTQTVRATPKRVPARGDIIDLRTWSGAPYRSKQTQLGLGLIIDVMPIHLDAHGIEIGPDYLSPSAAEKFAFDDGFSSEQELLEWFATTHGLPFDGILICWKLDHCLAL